MFAGNLAKADWLGKADWLDAARLRTYPWIFLAVYAVLIGWLILESPHFIERKSRIKPWLLVLELNRRAC